MAESEMGGERIEVLSAGSDPAAMLAAVSG